MDAQKIREHALKAMDQHARRYGATIPDKLKAFYKDDFLRFEGMYVKAQIGLGYGPDAAFQLGLTPPTWQEKGDDAVNGVNGDWEAAKHYLPIFTTDQDTFVVVDLRTPECRIGWYKEEYWNYGDRTGYKDGVYNGAPSLDDFVKLLKKEAPKADDTFRPAYLEGGGANWEWDLEVGDDD